MSRDKKIGYVPKEERETLFCRDCKRDLPLNCFTADGKTTAGRKKYRCRCIPCHSKHKKENHKSYKLYRAGKTYDKWKILAQDYKIKCFVCGYDRYKGALDFHHIDPTTKLFEISDVFWKKGTRKKITFDMFKIELKKCAVLCANCHREVHGGITKL